MTAMSMHICYVTF